MRVMAPWSTRLRYGPFKAEKVGSNPPGATQFIGSESLAIGKEK